MPCPITVTKFVGTITLGLLTGLSYSLSTTTLPTLLLLPTAQSASHTFNALKARSRSQIFALTTLASTSLLLAYTVSPRRAKHPYLLWTSFIAILGGPGVEYWAHGLQGMRDMVVVGGCGSLKVVPSWLWGWWRKEETKTSSSSRRTKEKEDDESDTVLVVNGESVGRDMDRERKVQRVRAGAMGLSFAMGLVGIWGDGA